MDNVKIRKLVESDYDQVIELYTQLDEFHVLSRPDCFVHREKDQIYSIFHRRINFSQQTSNGKEMVRDIC